MRAPRSLTIAIIALAIVAGVLVATLVTPTHQFHAESRFKVDTQETERAPDFSGADAGALRLLLDSGEGRRALAKAARVDERDFTLRKIAPVRGTAFVALEYCGVDSNVVERVASNAAWTVVRFYTTNQPDWRVTYLNTSSFTPPPPGLRLKRFFGF